jgi:myo-inositol-1(or 4)-monophosphatase
MTSDPRLLQTAIEIALRAGRLQLEGLRTGLVIEKKGAIDLVTQVDLEVERMARAVIAERFPDHTVLAEELPNERMASAASAYRWVFDPIDGTVNYAHGLPFFCASLALELEGRAILGVVYEPTHEELFVAERGAGARLNGVPLAVTATGGMLDAMLCTGFPYDVRETVDDLVGLFGAFVGRARAVRRFGSAALDLCYVAAGRLDGFWERRLNAWDMSAGALMVEEAGGRVTDMEGGVFDAHGGDILATNGPVHDEMLSTIRGFAVRSRNRTD